VWKKHLSKRWLVIFRSMLESYTEGLLARVQWLGWRATLCRLSEAVYFTLRINCHSPRPVGVCAIWALGARGDVASTVVNQSSHTCSSVQINSFILTANEKGSYCNLTDLLLLTDSRLTFYLTMTNLWEQHIRNDVVRDAEIWFNRCRGKVTYRLTAL